MSCKRLSLNKDHSKAVSKAEIRKSFLEMRRSLSPSRREGAKKDSLQLLSKKLEGSGAVLSFASKSEEIDLWPLNQALAHEGRLLLPRLISPTEIAPYAVSDLDNLLLNPTWNVLEPDPTLCREFPLKKIGVVLVPGVAFDDRLSRLGYGKGHYDRFLVKLSCPFYGVGFKEQLANAPLEVEDHDISLTELLLF